MGGCSGAPSFSATYSVDGGVATTVVTTGASVDIGLDRQHANISLDVVVVNGAGLAGPSNPGLLYLLAESTEPLNVCGWTRNGFVPPTLDVVLTWDMPRTAATVVVYLYVRVCVYLYVRVCVCVCD